MLAEKYQVSKLRVMPHVGISASSYYYREKSGRKGCLPSKQTQHSEKGEIDNQQVVKQIEKILSKPFQDYWGYHNITAELRDQGYLINHKKVYRLMKEEKLLKPSARLRPEKVARKFVRFRKVVTERPLQCVEMDIKCVWIPQRGKQAYLLSLLDVHTRRVLAHQLAWNMKKDQVIRLYASLVDQGQLPEGTIIRSDNGSQFLARQVREYLKMVGLDQEFTHVATPEENAHVEAYHGILKRELFNRFEYFTFVEADELIDQFVYYYNHKRRHGGIKRMTPEQMWHMEKHKIAPEARAA
jgi:transposase InsO family protein